MRLLLDTRVLLALIEQRVGVLPRAVQLVVAEPSASFHLSVASLWEVAIKWRLGKLQLTPSLPLLLKLIRALGIQLVPVNEHHVLAAVHPEPLTRDPFDRLLLAQCQVEGLRLVTIDRALMGHASAWQAAG